MIRITIITFCLIVACAAGLYAQTGYVALYSDTQFLDPYIGTEGPGLVSIYLVAHATVPVTAVQYWAPLPDCWHGATWLGETNQFQLTIGDSQGGISIAFGTCLTSPVHLQTITVMASDPPPNDVCCRMETLPDLRVPSGKIEFVDCSAAKFFGVPSASIVGDGSAPPTVGDRDPADGAEDLMLDVQLAWRTETCGYTPYTHTVYFGATPDPPVTSPDHETMTYDPGPLFPNTTYYWKITAWPLGDGGTTTTPLWSFTTGGGVPVETSTWGAIKALFK